MSALGICKRCINSESATRPKSSFERITSDSTSSTVMQAQVETGPTCWRMLACWKRTQHPDKCATWLIHHANLSCNATSVNCTLRADHLARGVHFSNRGPYNSTAHCLRSMRRLEAHYPVHRSAFMELQVIRGVWHQLYPYASIGTIQVSVYMARFLSGT
jgi:hypothetical protein